MSGKSEELAGRIIGLVDPLRRVLIQAARSAEELPPLTEAHATLLRVLVAAGPLRPAQAADELRLSRSTVSNLVRELTASGLIERSPSAADGRSVLLAPTPRASKQLGIFGQGRVVALARALDDVSAEDRERLAAALPVFSRVLDRLTIMTDLEEKE